jgi:lipopolysaccharide export LptBFGC system permease protein LptF
MKNLRLISFTSFACVLFFLSSIAAPQASAQKRDYMTDAESELVREAQEIDKRIDVLVKMIDRRFAVINNAALKTEKNSEKWGEPPTGSRIELLSDISKLLQKAIDDIDDVAAHNRMDSKLFPKAMNSLAEASNRYLSQLKSVYDQSPDQKEKGLISGASEFCRQIIEASAKVPKDLPKDEKKKKSKNDT